MNARALKLAASAPPCVAYTRVSKEEQAREGKASLGQQRDAVRVLAERLGVAVGDVFEDAGKSGGTANRPAFQALLRHCEEHRQPDIRPGFVLVLNDTRWGRFANPEEAAYWRVHLAKHGWIVRYSESDDSDDPTARTVMRAIGSATSTDYLVKIKANAKRGARGTAAKGYWCNEAPLGYRRSTVGGTRPGTVLAPGQLNTKDEHVKLVLGPESERRVVRFMFERYDSGEASLGILVAELKQRWPGLRKWSRPVVRQMLRNPALCGDVVWMVRSTGPRDGGQVNVRDAHAALIPRAMWDRVQVRLARNCKETRSTEGGYPLRGLLTCSACGASYMGAGGPKGPSDDPDRYRFYREKEGDEPCGHRQGTVQKREIEPLVIGEVAKVVAHPSVQRLIARELDRLLAADTSGSKRSLDKERAALEARRKQIIDRIGTLYSDTEAKASLDEIRSQLDGLAAQSEQAKFTAATRRAAASERDRLMRMAKDFTARAQKLSGAALRELLRPWLAGATVDKKDRTLTLTIRRVPMVLESPPEPD